MCEILEPMFESGLRCENFPVSDNPLGSDAFYPPGPSKVSPLLGLFLRHFLTSGLAFSPQASVCRRLLECEHFIS